MEGWHRVACAMGAVATASACMLYPGRTTTVHPSVGEAEPPRQQVEQPARQNVRSDARLEALIAYATHVRDLSPTRLEAEYAAAAADYRRSPDAVRRLRLAMLLGCPRAPFRDDARARELLHQVANDAAAEGAGVRRMAALLLGVLEERSALERALEDERRLHQAVQRKLEQLKTIEEEIDRRPSPPVVPAR